MTFELREPGGDQLDQAVVPFLRKADHRRRTFQAPGLDRWAAQDHARVGKGKRQKTFAIAAEGCECVARRVIVVLAGEAFQRAVGEALGPLHVADFPIVLVETRQIAGLGNGLLYAAESIDQPDLSRRAAVPDAALR